LLIRNGRPKRIWIHAASVGEVGAAAVLIRELEASGNSFTFVVSTMTITGQAIARRMLPAGVQCFLAPLDLRPAVRKVVDWARPDIYACLETELWPVMLRELHGAGVRMLLLNGRMTDRSFRRYSLVSGLLRQILSVFSAIAVIRPQDGERFAALGVPRERIRCTGNIKYDFPGEDIAALRHANRDRLQVNEETVFICGSTRRGEERILADVYRQILVQSGRDILWVIAPRHLKRIAEVEAMLLESGLPFDRYTELGSSKRTAPVVLVDCLGELSGLYSAGDFLFVGGSLVRSGGHNLMEAARSGRPVFYGPYVDDFSDAAEILAGAGAGFMVQDADQLSAGIMDLMRDTTGYRSACRQSLAAVSQQHGAARKQAGMILDALHIKNNYNIESQSQ